MNINRILAIIDRALLGFWKFVWRIVIVLLVLYFLFKVAGPYYAGRYEFFIDYYNSKH